MLSKKTMLCLDVLMAVASAPRGAMVTTMALSRHLQVSVSHLENAFKLLKQAGLVQAFRGPGGGYNLAMPAQDITLWEVVSRIGEPDEVNPPVHDKPLLSDALEHELHHALQAFLSTQTMADYANADHSWVQAPTPVRQGFGLSPMPVRPRPQAPNSVFALPAFLNLAAA
jgi:Rrf2 family iron-sulfur cluster assembly transcriptional regulator